MTPFPLLDIIIRFVVVYLFIVFAIRWFGKKELSQLSVIDLVFILLISNSVQNAMVGSDNSLQGGLIAAGALFLVNFILKYFLYHDQKLGKLLQGEPVLLVHKGNVIEENLKKQEISLNELESHRTNNRRSSA